MKNKLLLVIFALIISHSSYSISRINRNLRSPEANPNIITRRIQKLDLIIKKFENGFLSFTAAIARMLKKHERNINPKTLKALKEPLRLFIKNMKNNKLRNYRKYVLSKKQNGQNPPYHKFKNNNFFFYEILPERYQRQAAAGFMMQTRVMYLNPNYSPSSIFDNLVAFHEMVHALQDTTLRNKLKTLGLKGQKAFKRYIQLLNKNMKDPDLEPVAYAMELELLNIIFKGKIRRLIKSGRQIPLLQIAKILKATSRVKISALRFLLKYGIYYFNQNCWIYSYTKDYRLVILKDHMKMGHRFYQSENRFIKNNRAGQRNNTRENYNSDSRNNNSENNSSILELN